MTKEKVCIENVFTASKEQPAPVLLKFQNGNLTSTDKGSTLYFPVNCEEERTKHAVVIASGNVYSGTIESNLAESELTDTYICVHNKEHNKVRIIPIDQAKLINNVYQEKEMTKFTVMSKENSQMLITRNFGGRRDLRYLTNSQRNKFNIDVVKDQLENSIEQSSVVNSSEPEVTAAENIPRIRPRFNKDATNLESIFDLNDVIPSDLIERLEEEANALKDTEIIDIPIPSEFLKEALVALRKGKDSSENLLKYKIIIYMDALQTLIKTKEKNLKKIELSQITEKVENDIRERFSDENKSNHRTSFSNEKALCYYLVLAFMISANYELDVNVLAKELCMSNAKIVKYAQMINATPKSRTNILLLRLPSDVKPLNFGFIGRRKKTNE